MKIFIVDDDDPMLKAGNAASLMVMTHWIVSWRPVPVQVDWYRQVIVQGLKARHYT